MIVVDIVRRKNIVYIKVIQNCTRPRQQVLSTQHDLNSIISLYFIFCTYNKIQTHLFFFFIFLSTRIRVYVLHKQGEKKSNV